MPGCLLWCVRTDTTCLWLTAVNWSNILAVCDMFCIMFCLIFPSEKILWKTQRPAAHQAACPELNFAHMLHVHYLLINYNPQMTQCPAPYATPIVHIWSGNTHEEGTGIGFPRIKPFIIPDRRPFLSPFIRFVIFRRCLLGRALRTAGIIRDGAVAGSPSDLALALKTYTNNSHACGVVCPLPFCPASLVVLSVFEILCWPIKAAPGPLMAFGLVS